jgi:predicted exporter
MTMKRTELEKLKARRLEGGMRKDVVAGRLANAGSEAPSRREQRERERALGLVPFAVKLQADLVKEIHARAQGRQVDLNELVAELLRKGLDG